MSSNITIPEKPYLSIVAASRNDDHGGNILKRMRLFVSGLIQQANRYKLNLELILVEWNPPLDRPFLHEILPKPTNGDYLSVRYIQVPAEIQKEYRRAREIPLFQMIAKNVGIRRANGEFVLSTNIDLLFSDELFALLANRNLRKDSYYRANRCDVPDRIDPEWDIERQLKWCSENVIRCLGRDMRFKNVNIELIGFDNQTSWIKKWTVDKMALGMRLFWPKEKQKFYQLDSYACGDFTLISKDAWMKMNGYPELDLYSIHVDTLGLIALNILGYKQNVLPGSACTYHIDHPNGWESMNPFEKIEFLQERPGIDYSLVLELGLYALKKKEPFRLNTDNWGYADRSFSEFTFPVVEKSHVKYV